MQNMASLLRTLPVTAARGFTARQSLAFPTTAHLLTRRPLSTESAPPSSSSSPATAPERSSSSIIDAMEQKADGPVAANTGTTRTTPKSKPSRPSDSLDADGSAAWQKALRTTSFHFSPSSPSNRRSQPYSQIPPDERWTRHSYPTPYSQPVTTTTARSFAVKDNDLARAYRNLNRVLMENNVRRELKQQERFESGSDRRVRLDSARHRRRFKVHVGKSVSQAMRNRLV